MIINVVNDGFCTVVSNSHRDLVSLALTTGITPEIRLEVMTRYKYVQVLAAKRIFYVNSICGVKIKSRRVYFLNGLK